MALRGATIQLGDDGEELGADVALPAASAINWHHLIHSSFQGGSKAAGIAQHSSAFLTAEPRIQHLLRLRGWR